MGIFKRMTFENKSVFISWLLSYFLILLVPISISAYVYIKAEKIVESDVNKANAGMLAQSQQAMEGGLEDINNFIYQIDLNNNLRRLMNINGEPDNYDYSIVYQAVHDFSCYKVFTGFIEDFFVYFKGIDKILAGNGLLTKDIFYASCWKNTLGNNTITYNQFVGMLKGENSRKYIITGKKRN